MPLCRELRRLKPVKLDARAASIKTEFPTEAYLHIVHHLRRTNGRLSLKPDWLSLQLMLRPVETNVFISAALPEVPFLANSLALR
jgi:hypothetical protein